jgi:hypothetical protein
MIGFQAFVDYVGLKIHFSDSKFIWHPGQKRRIRQATFEKRSDCAFFVKLERDHRIRESWIEAIVSGFIYDPDLWVGQLFEDEVSDHHKDRMRRVAGLESIFAQDCDKIHFYMFDEGISLQNLLLTSPEKDPIIISLHVKKLICLETLVLLHHLNPWVSKWSPINPLQVQRRILIQQYHHLLHLADRDLSKLKTTYQLLSAS